MSTIYSKKQYKKYFTIFKNHEQRKKNFDGDTIHK